MAVTLLSVREWEEQLISREGLTVHEADFFEALAKHAAQRLRLPESAVLPRTSRGLKAQQVVGILAIPGRTLEILPKIDNSDDSVRRALIRMLAVAYDLRVAEGELSSTGTQRHDLFELLIHLFADRLLSVVQRGLARRYVNREEDLKLLRGRLNVVRQFTHLAVRPDRLACQFEELSEDTPLNRVLKAAVTRLARLTRSAANARLLSEIAARFEFTGDSPRPLAEAVILDRTNSAFHHLHRLARLFLAGDWQNTSTGDSLGFTLLFPMNELFEKFIGRSLQRAMYPQRVALQRREKCALETMQGAGVFTLIPDVVIESEPKPTVLDTKWKRLDSTQKHLGVEQPDVYQMLAYGRAWNAERVILLYPWHKGLGREAGFARRWRATGAEGLFLEVSTVNVGIPEGVVDTLRSVVSKSADWPMEALQASAPKGPALEGCMQ